MQTQYWCIGYEDTRQPRHAAPQHPAQAQPLCHARVTIGGEQQHHGDEVTGSPHQASLGRQTARPAREGIQNGAAERKQECTQSDHQDETCKIPGSDFCTQNRPGDGIGHDVETDASQEKAKVSREHQSQTRHAVEREDIGIRGYLCNGPEGHTEGCPVTTTPQSEQRDHGSQHDKN